MGDQGLVHAFPGVDINTGLGAVDAGRAKLEQVAVANGQLKMDNGQ